MNFARPHIFLFLWIVVPLLLTVYWGMSRRQKILNDYAAGNGLARLAQEASPGRRTAGALLLVLSAAMALIALSGPRYGYRWEKIEQKGVDLMVALDCSRSMLAEDIPPSRLTRAKYEIIDLLRMLGGDRIGLTAFAGSAFLQCPLTMDYGAFHLFLDALSPDMLPVGGTNLGDAVRTAISGFNEADESDKAVILITDGEQTTGPDPIEAARQAAEKKIKIFCIGVGEAQGAPVPEETGGFKKDRAGKMVLTRLDEETLKQMAAATGGAYVRSVAGDMDLETIYQDKIRSTMKQTTLESGKKKIWEDRFQWFLALALFCLALEMLLPRRRAAVALMVLLMIGGAGRARADSVYTDVEQGRTAYDAQQYDDALQHFIDAQLADPENARLYYNIGNAYYKAGKHKEAADSFQKALDLISDDKPFQENVWYNLGNARFRQKNFTGAIEAYQQALNINAEDKEARENLELAQKAAEEQKKQQQQSDRQESKNQQQQKEEQSPQQQQQNQADNQSGEKGQPQKQPDQNNGKQSSDNKTDQTRTGQKPEPSADKNQDQTTPNGKPETGDKGEQREKQQTPAGGQSARQQPQQQDQQQAGAMSSMPDQGEKRLNRLQDKPGGAMIVPDYRKREVEQDW